MNLSYGIESSEICTTKFNTHTIDFARYKKVYFTKPTHPRTFTEIKSIVAEH